MRARRSDFDRPKGRRGVTPLMLRHAARLAAETGSKAVLACGDLSEYALRLPAAGVRLVVLAAGDSSGKTAVGDAVADHAVRLCVPALPPTRGGRVRLGLLHGLVRGIFDPNDRVVCLSGPAGRKRLDSVTVRRAGEGFEAFLDPGGGRWASGDLRPEVMLRIIGLATELGSEGREGSPVGALFIAGDAANVLPRTHQMVLNPFAGHPPDRRNLLDASGLGETVKEFSSLDGAFVITGGGVIETAGAHVDAARVEHANVSPGLGARHRAAAAITAATEAVAVVLSQSTGTVTVFRRGRVAVEFPGRRGAGPQPVPRRRGGERVLVIGGGILGLAAAWRLAEDGLTVTVLEGGRLGRGATLKNQGWLWSGGWIAPHRPDLAGTFHRSLRRTLEFAPDCVEPDAPEMLYLFTQADTQVEEWTDAWASAGIPFDPVRVADAEREFPGLTRGLLRAAFRLPDRAVRFDFLLRRLAAACRRSGVDLRTQTRVRELAVAGEEVRGVVTADGERLPAGLVVVATGAAADGLTPAPAHGSPAVRLARSRTILAAFRPAAARTPFCIADLGGFNHLPHGDVSVFGSNRWTAAAGPEDDRIFRREGVRLHRLIRAIFSDLPGAETVRWGATTVQGVAASEAPWDAVLPPTVFDHAGSDPLRRNLLSVVAGRASLWPAAAEATREAVWAKLNAGRIAAPRWLA